MKTVIEMAREADFGDGIVEFIGVQKFERFAELVRAAEREKWMERTAILIRGEREACAKVCEKAIASIWEYSPEDVKQTGTNVCNNLATAIRARSNT